MYYFTYNNFLKRYLVVNTQTGLAHSSWENLPEAFFTMKSLNDFAKRYPAKKPTLKLVRG